MSNDATHWAIKQRGLKPMTRIVLWHLADRHNKDLGYAFPKQMSLAADCEISRASLNRHLDELESRGLIRRKTRKDPHSGKQLETWYYLAFDTEIDPQDVVGRVSRCDTENRVSKTEETVSHSSETPITGNITKTPLPPSSPSPNPSASFNKIWNLWPDSRRGNRDQAEKALARCDDEVVGKLPQAAELYLSFQNRQPAAEKKRTALLSEFIRSGLYEDFIDPPEISFDGHFKITETMPEWAVWMRSLAALHKREIGAVEKHFKNAGGVLLVRTRWPDGYKQRST